MSTPLVTFQQVVFGYNKRTDPVIDDLGLGILEGSITAILGPNGAGKTTLLFLALGWLKPWSGSIMLSNKPLQSYSRRELGQQLALVPQSEYVPFQYTVMEYVLLGRAPYMPPLGMPSVQDEEVAFHALERVGIAQLSSHSVTELSGGERQLVLVARALAQDPRILLLDEPTSHLDLSNKFRLVNILKSLQAQGTTILMTTHEPDIALAVSDDAILMEKGRVLAIGSRDDVITGNNLTEIYHVPVRIVSVEGKNQVQWI